MKSGWIAVVAVVGAVLAGCGPTEVGGEAGERLTSAASPLVTCSTTCWGGATLSCSGTKCSGADSVYVECDGAFQQCPSCEYFVGTSVNSYEEACSSALQSARDNAAEYCGPFGGGERSISRLCVHDANTPPYRGSYRVCCNT
jgi:hypothetical protein